MDNNGGVVIVLDTMFQCVASKWMAAIIGDRFMEFMSFCFRVKVRARGSFDRCITHECAGGSL